MAHTSKTGRTYAEQVKADLRTAEKLKKVLRAARKPEPPPLDVSFPLTFDPDLAWAYWYAGAIAGSGPSNIPGHVVTFGGTEVAECDSHALRNDPFLSIELTSGAELEFTGTLVRYAVSKVHRRR